MNHSGQRALSPVARKGEGGRGWDAGGRPTGEVAPSEKSDVYSVREIQLEIDRFARQVSFTNFFFSQDF